MCENLKNSSCQLSAGKAHSKTESILRNFILRKTWTSWENDEKYCKSINVTNNKGLTELLLVSLKMRKYS